MNSFTRNLVLSAGVALAAGRLEAARLTEFPLPAGAGFPTRMIAGPDGRLWLIEPSAKRVRAVTTTGNFSEFALTAVPYDLAVIPGKIVAIAEDTGLGFVNASGTVFESPSLSNPESLTFGPDGRLWVADFQSQLVAFHFLANSPQTEYVSLPGFSASVAVGRDGRIWGTLNGASGVAACPPDGGACSTYPVPSNPSRLAPGPDGSVWFTLPNDNAIGRITPQGGFSQYVVPTAGSAPRGICAGPDGNMWFTEYFGQKLGRITPAGVITEFPLGSDCGPTAIALGSDGALWFTEYQTKKVGRFQVLDSADVNADGNDDVADVFYLINDLFAGGPAPK